MRTPPETGPLLSLDEALALVLAQVRPLDAESVGLADAAGRVLAEDAVAAVDLPPFSSSAMDGFAVRAADLPGTLPVVGRSAAGRPFTRALAAGEVVEIATGGVVPEGADAVVPVEESDLAAGRVTVAGGTAPGAHVRPAGGDVARGAPLLARGAVLRPALVAALAAAGIGSVRCARRPRVAVLSTGTELRAPGAALGPGQIYDANTPLLAAAVDSAGGIAKPLEPAADDAESHRAAVALGLDSDVLVTSGGVSVGPHDLVRRVEAELGVQEVFWRVAVRPGKPVSFGVRGRTLVFGLPGNPVSTLVGFELFVRPALRALQGTEPGPHYLPGRLARSVRRLAERDQLVRARTRVETEGVVLEPLEGQESHMIARASGADALVLIRRGDGELPAGAAASYLPF